MHFLASCLQVDGEKTFHLRVAAILGEVEAEVSSRLYFSQEFNLFHQVNVLLYLYF